MRLRFLAIIATVVVFLGGAFGLGFSAGALTTNHRLDCRQGHDDEIISLFAELVTVQHNPTDLARVEQKLAALPPSRC